MPNFVCIKCTTDNKPVSFNSLAELSAHNKKVHEGKPMTVNPVDKPKPEPDPKPDFLPKPEPKKEPIKKKPKEITITSDDIEYFT